MTSLSVPEVTDNLHRWLERLLRLHYQNDPSIPTIEVSVL